MAKTIECQTLSVDEVTETLGIGRNLTYELIKQGRIKALRLGKRLVVSKVVIQQLLENPENLRARVADAGPDEGEADDSSISSP